jgi:hypothetical protein
MIRPRTAVLSAAALVLVLAGTLGVRLLAQAKNPPGKQAAPVLPRLTEPAPRAAVPAPGVIGALKVPCWGCPDANEWPVAFRTDLDLLAPLGDGQGNAALWLKDFNKEVGARYGELEKAMARRVAGPEEFPTVFAADDPLLREAEPWADQATMRTYPDVYPVIGTVTRLPNLLFAINLAKGWAARAASRPGTPEALEDARRVIRWGRLLRQDDVTIIQDLVGLACLRLGAEQLYDAAVRRGDHQLALAAAMALGEHAPQRLRTAELLTRLELTTGEGLEPVHLGSVFRSSRGMPERKLGAILDAARKSRERRFRFEAIAQMQLVRQAGTAAQREKVESALKELSADRDALIAADARHALETTLDPALVESLLGPPTP